MFLLTLGESAVRFLTVTGLMENVVTLQDPNNRNMVICDDKLKSILLGKPHVELAELPLLIKLHFPKVSK